MTCSDFLNLHTDYQDGGLSPENTSRIRAHLASCPSCRRYDSVVNRGVDLLRSLPVTEPTEDFRARLQHSIYTLHEERRRSRLPGAGSSAMSWVAMGAIAASLVLTPMLWESEEVADLPAIVVAEPAPRSRPLPVSVRDPALVLWPVEESDPLAEPDLWTQSNALLYQHSSLYSRYREPSLIATGLR